MNDPELLLDHQRFEERKRYAAEHALPAVMFHTVSETYRSVAERVTGRPLEPPDRPLESMMTVLGDEMGLAR